LLSYDNIGRSDDDDIVDNSYFSYWFYIFGTYD